MKGALLCLSMALCFAASQATGAPTLKGAPPGYEAQYKQVLEAEKNEEYEKALTLLDQIPADKQNVYTRLKRADLLVRMGKFVEAEAILSALLKDPVADAIRPTVQGDIDDLRARMPKLTVRIADGSPNDAWVTVDDQPIGPPVTLPMNPGTHAIVAKRAGVEVFRQKVTLQDGQKLEVEIDTSVAPPSSNVSANAPKDVVAAKTTTVDTDTTTTAGNGRSPTLAYVALGAGVVFLGGAIFGQLSASSANDDRKAACASQTSPACDDTGRTKVRTWETISFVSAGLSAASFGLSIYLFAASSKSASTATVSTLRLGMVPSNSPTVALEGSF